MKATLIECFPDPLTPLWPVTANPVSCEARQIYSLVAIACCVPGAHVLVLHDQEATNHLRSCMTRGFKYMDYKIEESTTATQMADFFVSAQKNTSQVTHSPRNGVGSAEHQSIGELFSIQGCAVACVRGAHVASPEVLSTLMDAMGAGQVRCGADGITHCIPSVHVLLFCREKSYVEVLSERFRACFALSMFVSSLTMDRAPILRNSNIRNSTIINKKNLIEVVAYPESLHSVSLSSEVSGYLRHLLLVLRGSVCPGSAAGTYAVRQVSMHRRIIRAVAVLFQPPPEALAVRGPPDVSFAGRRQSTTVNERYSYARSNGPTDFSDVIVSPADVLCMLCPMVSHLFTLRRSHVRLLTTPLSHLRRDSSSSLLTSAAGGAAGNSRSRSRFPPVTDVEENEPLRNLHPNGRSPFHSLFDPIAAHHTKGNKLASQPPTPSVQAVPIGAYRVRDGLVDEPEAEKDTNVVSYMEVRNAIRFAVIAYSAPSPG